MPTIKEIKKRMAELGLPLYDAVDQARAERIATSFRPGPHEAYVTQVRDQMESIRHESQRVHESKAATDFLMHHFAAGTRVAEENVSRNDRDLDRICKILAMGHLQDQICVAACWRPPIWGLAPRILITTNKADAPMGVDPRATNAIINNFHSEPTARQTQPERTQLKADYAGRTPHKFSYQLFNGVKNWHEDKLSDSHHILSALRAGSVSFVTTPGKDVHAELRLLDYMEWYSRKSCPSLRPNDPAPIYIGVSMLCCSKCAVFLHMYRRSDARLFLPQVRGRHGVMDSNWKRPPELSRTIFGDDDSGPYLIEASQLTMSDLSPNVGRHMTHDLSDSEAENE